MVSLSKIAAVFVLVIVTFYVPSCAGRKSLSMEAMKVPALKGKTTPISFGRRFGYEMANTMGIPEAAGDHRILQQSNPSPSIGN